jgi:mercuric ion transport protein
MSQQKLGRWPLIGGFAAAVGASLCCIGPLVLVMLGIGGAWVANLTALEPFRPYFLAAAVVFLFLAYRKIYRTPAAAACTPGSLCALPRTNQVYKALFWLVALLIGLAITFPYIAPFFY